MACVIPSTSFFTSIILTWKRPVCIFSETAKTEKLGRMSSSVARPGGRKLEKWRRGQLIGLSSCEPLPRRKRVLGKPALEGGMSPRARDLFHSWLPESKHQNCARKMTKGIEWVSISTVPREASLSWFVKNKDVEKNENNTKINWNQVSYEQGYTEV